MTLTEVPELIPARMLNEYAHCALLVRGCSFWLAGVSTGMPGKNVMLRILQAGMAARRDLAVPRKMIQGKIRNGRVLLRKNDSLNRVVAQFAGLAEQAGTTDAVNCLLSFCYALLAKEVLAACL